MPAGRAFFILSDHHVRHMNVTAKDIAPISIHSHSLHSPLPRVLGASANGHDTTQQIRAFAHILKSLYLENYRPKLFLIVLQNN